MKLVFNIKPDIIIETYNRVKIALNGNDTIIFNAMQTISRLRGVNFTPPTNNSQFPQKHTEIERILKRISITQGQELATLLFEKIWEQLNLLGGLPGVHNLSFLNEIRFILDEDKEHIIKLTNDSSWVVEWMILLPEYSMEDKISLLICDNSQDIVPNYILQYMKMVVYAYYEGMYAVALALCSIIMEATLRDNLSKRGYTFIHGNRTPQNITGLGKAIDIARNTERILTSFHLTEDLDEVIKTVRNNLVHLSGSVFATPLIAFNSLSTTGNFVLGDFIKDQKLVFDLITNVSRCINDLYNENK